MAYFFNLCQNVNKRIKLVQRHSCSRTRLYYVLVLMAITPVTVLIYSHFTQPNHTTKTSDRLIPGNKYKAETTYSALISKNIKPVELTMDSDLKEQSSRGSHQSQGGTNSYSTYTKTHTVNTTGQRHSLVVPASNPTLESILNTVLKTRIINVHEPTSLLREPYFTKQLNTSQKDYTFNCSVLLDPQPRCASAKDLLVIIPSIPNMHKTRQTIRETWGSVVTNRWPRNKYLSMRVTLVFVLGVQKSDLKNDSYDSYVGLFEKEQAQFNDLLIFNMTDSYRNLTMKMLLALTWIENNCHHISYVLKIDQDIFVNFPLVTALLKYRGENNSVYGSFYPKGAVVKRVGRWGVPVSTLPLQHYPVYASGAAYIISKDAVTKLVHIYPRFQPIPIEDAFITGILPLVSGIKQNSVNGFTHFGQRIPSVCNMINGVRYFGNGFTDDTIKEYWNVLLDEKKIC